MITVPTTKVTVLGPVAGGAPTFDDNGDPIESSDPTSVILTNVPFAIIERRLPQASPESSGQVSVVRYYVGRGPSWMAVDNTQRIRDENTGDIYLIDNVSRPHHSVLAMDVRLDLRRAE